MSITSARLLEITLPVEEHVARRACLNDTLAINTGDSFDAREDGTVDRAGLEGALATGFKTGGGVEALEALEGYRTELGVGWAIGDRVPLRFGRGYS